MIKMKGLGRGLDALLAGSDRSGGDEQRSLLYELDMNLLALRQRHGDTTETTGLTGTYHNLLRMWAET